MIPFRANWQDAEVVLVVAVLPSPAPEGPQVVFIRSNGCLEHADIYDHVGQYQFTDCTWPKANVVLGKE